MGTWCSALPSALQVLEAFRKFGIGCLTLEGGPIQLRTVIDKFEAPSNTDDFVLMCSLQKKAAGTNLQCANHVLFVHPFFARSDEQCMAWEAQAIGRVQRYGQTKQVWPCANNSTGDQGALSVIGLG